MTMKMKMTVRRVVGTLLAVLMLVSLNMIPAVAATQATAAANVVSSGATVLKGTYMFNCTTGAVGSSGDIFWNQMTTIQRQMVPQGNAKIVNLGKVNFDTITAVQLAGYTYGTTPIPGNNDTTNQLVTNDVFAVRTQLGNYAKIQVVSYGYDLSIKWVTYRAPLTTPLLVSPANGQAFLHYPRTTTLSWKPVSGATSYLVERQYYDTTWKSYPNVTVSGTLNTSYKFDFIGDQPGRWRVTALSSNSWSAPSAWWTFSYMTAPKLATPVQVSPANGIDLYNYPRTTTLTWRPVPGASSYLVEVQYYDTTWKPYPNVTVVGALTASYTFNFVGAQPGQWRVTALAPAGYKNSNPSIWNTFRYRN